MIRSFHELAGAEAMTGPEGVGATWCGALAVVESGRAPAEVRLRLGVVYGALAVVDYALTQAVSLPLWVTLRMAWSLRWAQEHNRESSRD